MTSSNELDKIAPAIVAFQAEVANPKKTADNPFFKSKYADLDEIINTVRQTLSANGLCVIQSPEGEGSVAKVTTRLMHTSGQWIEGTIALTAAKSDPQGMGSAITYARRYSLAAFLNLAQDDDDANSVSGKDDKATKTAPKPTVSGYVTPPAANSLPPAVDHASPEQRCRDIRAELDMAANMWAGVLAAHNGKIEGEGAAKHWVGVDWPAVLIEMTERKTAAAREANLPEGVNE